MLTEDQLEEQFERLGTPPGGRERIRWIRANAPTRRVGCSSRATKVRYSSRKMGFVLEGEAYTTEYAALETLDADPDTLEFYPQPGTLRIHYLNANGNRVHPDITPDIFRISASDFVFVECKTEEKLVQLAAELPDRYQRDSEGRWRSPPAEAAAQALGCQFRLRSNAENNWTLIENIDFLKDYREVSDAYRREYANALAIIGGRLNVSNWVTVRELIDGDPPVPADAIYALIIDKQIYFDLLGNRISDTDQALIFRNEAMAAAFRVAARTSVGLQTSGLHHFEPIVGSRFTWDGTPWQVLNQTEEHVTASRLAPDGKQFFADLTHVQLSELARSGRIVSLDEQDSTVFSEAHEILRSVSPAKIQIALYRREILFAAATDQNPLVRRKQRAVAYWLADYRKAEKQYGLGLIGLIPDVANRQGNHQPKLDPLTYKLAITTIVELFETGKQPSISLCHGDYINACHAKGVQPASLPTFSKIIAARKDHNQTKSRVGEKAAYSEEPEYLVLERTTPRHGNRPLHIGHLDHTPIPLKIKDERGNDVDATIWLTLMLDAYSRSVLAFYLSFDHPSHVACMMVIRDCVRRHGRVPNWIVVDQGAEFNGTYFEMLLGMLEINKRERPGGKARFGSVIERLFGTTVEQFVENLIGATHDMNPRQVGKDIDPTRYAVWTFNRLWSELERFFREVYHVNVHSGIGASPNVAMAAGLHTGGTRAHRRYAYDRDFLIATCPSTLKGEAKIQNSGVKINHLYYNCQEMSLPGVRGTSVPVRYEPFDRGRAYAYIRGRWCECLSEYYAIFREFSDRQVRLATQALILKTRVTAHADRLNASTLAAYLRSVEGRELVMQQRLLDQESAEVRSAVSAPSGDRNDLPDAPTGPEPTPAPNCTSKPEALEEF